MPKPVPKPRKLTISRAKFSENQSIVCTYIVLITNYIIYVYLSQDTEFMQQIESYNKNLYNYLNYAKQNKKCSVTVQHVKIFLTGSAAAGKTGFRSLLLNCPFDENQASTDVLETRLAYAVQNSASLLQSEEGDVIWYQLTPNQQLIYFKSLLDKGCHTKSDKSNPIVDYSTNGDDSIPLDIHIDQPSPSLLETKVLKSDMLPKNLDIGDTVKIITIIDTGGQPGYIHLLPAIVNSPTINFIVHDMTKDLDDPVQVRYKKGNQEEIKPYQLNYSNKDLIKLIMSLSTESLNISANPLVKTSNHRLIGFVGTHKDKIKDPGERALLLNEKLNDIINQQNCKVDVLTIEDKKVLCTVDNTTAGKGKDEDSTVKIIRKKIENLMQSMNSYPLPVTWMILELELQELRIAKKRSYITFKEYSSIAKDRVSIVNEEEIKASLQYYHFLEVLLYFEDIPGLCDYVIIDQQWLYNKVSMFVHMPSELISIIGLSSQILFETSGILLKDECRSIKWKEDIPVEHFISFLIHKNVMAEFIMDKQQYYYLPYILPYSQQYHDKYLFLLSEPLLIQFSNGVLPRGFFCSLIVHLLQDLPCEWQHDLLSSTSGTKKHFKNVMTFCLPDDFYLRVQDRINYLELQIRHYKDNKLESAFYLPQILPTLQKYLEAVCQKLKFDYEKLQYGFLCHDRESTDDDHIAVIPSITSRPSKLPCSKKCKYQTVIGTLHTVWFEKVHIPINAGIIIICFKIVEGRRSRWSICSCSCATFR